MASFESPTPFRALHQIHDRHSRLFSSPNDNGDVMRRMLEESWNTSKMGRVPADPESAAKEAFSSILQAAGATAADGENLVEEDSMSGIFFVDLLLPSYDMSILQQGVNLYDEVAAVEYCISLANCFKGKTEILVKDNTIVKTVTKILKAREDLESEKAAAENGLISDGDIVFGSGDDESGEPAQADATVRLDSDDADRDAFRQQLLANWNDYSSDPIEDGIDTSRPKTKNKVPTSNSKSYRLASLFGNYRIFKGADMANLVIQAVRENALPAADENNIIILGARGQDEMVAVRGLVAKYANQKKIILVNSQFQPVPRELLSAETVYSVLPLAGKKAGNNDNGNTNDEGEKPPPKIVVLRRYPKDWEVFVDVGIGYELAETVKATPHNRRGLPMDFIARAVTRHLDYVSRR